MRERFISEDVASLIGWLIIVFIAASFGAAASINADSFYVELSRPDWAPPSWVFGPVWTTLYLLMAVAAWLVWRTNPRRAGFALGLFFVQLLLNALWSWLFFAWALGALAFFDTVLLLALIAATTYAFWKINRLAGVLLIPYFVWVGFASLLNYSVWQMNPHILG